jgi:hypothetical protein
MSYKLRVLRPLSLYSLLIKGFIIVCTFLVVIPADRLCHNSQDDL